MVRLKHPSTSAVPRASEPWSGLQIASKQASFLVQHCIGLSSQSEDPRLAKMRGTGERSDPCSSIVLTIKAEWRISDPERTVPNAREESAQSYLQSYDLTYYFPITARPPIPNSLFTTYVHWNPHQLAVVNFCLTTDDCQLPCLEDWFLPPLRIVPAPTHLLPQL